MQSRFSKVAIPVSSIRNVSRTPLLERLEGRVFLSATPAAPPDTSEYHSSIGGVVFADLNHNGKRDPGEHGLGGARMQLIDASGKVVAKTLTRPDGGYLFGHLDTGSYTVKELLPPGAPKPSLSSAVIKITTDGTMVKHIDFANAPPPAGSDHQPPPPPPPPQNGTGGPTDGGPGGTTGGPGGSSASQLVSSVATH